MTTQRTGSWLLVALAIVGLALVATAVSAHGTDTATDGPQFDDETVAPPENGSAAAWERWMEARMTEHMGPGAVAWMESHMGITIEELARDVAAGDHGHDGYRMHGDDPRPGTGDGYRRGHDTGGQGHGMMGRGHGC